MATSARSERQFSRQLKRQVPKETFHKWQWTYKREHQLHGYVLKWMTKTSLLCLRIGALFVGSMRLEWAGPKTSSGHGPSVQATIKWATSLTTPTVSHTKRLWCTFTCYCTYILYVIIAQCTSIMKCVRSTFCDGWSSYILVWQSSGCYQVVIFIPEVECDKSELTLNH